MSQNWLFIILCLVWVPFAAADEFVLTLENGDELTINRHTRSTAKQVLIWLPSEYGLSPRQQPTIKALVERDFELWLPDFHSSWFLPPGPGSFDQINTNIVMHLLNEAVRRRPGQIYIMAQGRAAVLALQGIRQWQLAGGDTQRLTGTLLLHPKLYVETPQGGEKARYLPIVRASNVPIFIMQPTLSSGVWRLQQLVQALGEGGSSVYQQRLNQVSDGFNLRPDASEDEIHLTEQLPQIINRATRILTMHGGTPSSATPLQPKTQTTSSRPQQLLRPYTASRPTPSLSLPRLKDGKMQSLPQGRAVLVNFWATWCPPCVEEIPSLNRLYQRLAKKGLKIIGVDVGETPQQVKSFLRDMDVAFPIVLDESGMALKSWQVYAFPTTFLLDHQGRIRYAVYGGLDWDSPEVVSAIEAVMRKD